MKINYIITSLECGGAEFAMIDIIKEIRALGHHVTVTACEASNVGLIPFLEKEDIPYHILFERRPHIIKSVYGYIKELKEKKADIIWTSLSRASTVGQISGKILGIPVVTWKHSVKRRLSITLGKKLPTLWVADSSCVAHYLHEKMNIPLKKIMVWPLYIARSPSVSPLPWDGNGPLHIGSSGRLHGMKNYPYLLKSLILFRSRHPKWFQRVHLTIAGEGPQRPKLEKIIREHNLEKNVSLLGFVQNVPDYLKKLHLYVQPSNYEGMCLAAHEAMAAGLPVISTPVGELSYSIQDNKTGLILERDEGVVESFCAKLEHIFQHPDCLAYLGKNAQHYVFSHFSYDQYSSKCQHIIKHITSLTKVE